MSLQEVVELARTLPRGEQIQLIDELRRDPGEPSDDVLKFFPPGSVGSFWHADVLPESKQVLVEMLEQIELKKINAERQ